MIDNAEWLAPLNYIDFLRDVGRHFSVNRMLSMDSVKLRLDREHELTFLEFNYMVLQAYDFVELARRHDCHPADRRLRPVGQHRQRHRSRPPHGPAAALRPHLPAAHHGVGRQDGQDRRRRRLAQRRHAVALRILAVLAQHRGRRRRALPQALHRAAARRDRAAWRRSTAARSTRPRRFSPPRRPRSSTAAPRPTRRRRPRGAPSRKAGSPRRCRPSPFPRAELAAGIGVLGAVRARRAGRLERRGPPRRSAAAACGVNDKRRHRRTGDRRRPRRYRRRRRQAVARPQETRARPAGVISRLDNARPASLRLELEDLAEDAGRHRRQRVEEHPRLGDRPVDLEGDADQALAGAAAERSGRRSGCGRTGC